MLNNAPSNSPLSHFSRTEKSMSNLHLIFVNQNYFRLQIAWLILPNVPKLQI